MFRRAADTGGYTIIGGSWTKTFQENHNKVVQEEHEMENTKKFIPEDDEKEKAAKHSEQDKNEAADDEKLDIEDYFATLEFIQDLDDIDLE